MFRRRSKYHLSMADAETALDHMRWAAGAPHRISEPRYTLVASFLLCDYLFTLLAPNVFDSYIISSFAASSSGTSAGNE